jgi:hypothetical protein
MSLHYLAYGWRVASDIPLSYARAREGAPADHTIRMGEATGGGDLALVHDLEDFPGGPVLTVRMDDDATTALIDYAGWRALLEPASRTMKLARTGAEEVPGEQLVERVVLPLYTWLARRDAVALHGSCVARGGRAIALIGASGQGKSTAAAALLAMGCRLVADDMTLIDVPDASALPGAPTLRLWDGAVDTSSALRREPILGLDDKHWYLMPGDDVPTPTPLRGVLELRRDDGAPATGRITRLRGVEALSCVLAQTFDLTAPPERWSRRRVAAARALCQRVPVARLSFAPSPDRRPLHAQAALAWLDGEDPA